MKLKPRVILLGPAGSFSDIALNKLKLSYRKKYVFTISSVFRNIRIGDFGFIPVRNKIIGGISASRQIKNPKWRIKKRFKMKVNFVLAAKRKLRLEDIKSLYCSLVARKQCGKFIKLRLAKPKIVPEFSSTSFVFKKVVQKKDFYAAVIGSSAAAKLYGFKILAANIQDDPQDWTKFVLFTAIQ